ncbi:MAG: hypothetical protein V3S31_07400, partial [Dehalococcoidia bacterium]
MMRKIALTVVPAMLIAIVTLTALSTASAAGIVADGEAFAVSGTFQQGPGGRPSATPLGGDGGGRPDGTPTPGAQGGRGGNSDSGRGGRPENPPGRGRLANAPQLPEQASDTARARVTLVFERHQQIRAVIAGIRDLPKEERKGAIQDLMADFRELFKALS